MEYAGYLRRILIRLIAASLASALLEALLPRDNREKGISAAAKRVLTLAMLAGVIAGAWT